MDPYAYARDWHFSERKLRKIEHAIRQQDVASVSRYLPEVNVNEVSEQVTLLTLALDAATDSADSLGILRVLLEAGADPNIPRGKLPLLTAIQDMGRFGAEPFRLLLEKGARLEEVPDKYANPVLFELTRSETDLRLVDILLEKKVDLGKVYPSGLTFLGHVANTGSVEMRDRLLEAGYRYGGYSTAFSDEPMETFWRKSPHGEWIWEERPYKPSLESASPKQP